MTGRTRVFRVAVLTLTVVAVAMLSLATVALAQGEAAVVDQNYCMKGTSDDTGWSWRIRLDSNDMTITEDLEVDPVPNGEPAQTIAEQWVASLRAQPETQDSELIPVASLATTCGSDWEAGFQITATTTASFTLSVGASGGPPTDEDCLMDTPCNFNPTVAQAPTPTPSFTAWGQIALIALLLLAGSIVILRALRARPDMA